MKRLAAFSVGSWAETICRRHFTIRSQADAGMGSIPTG